jgi:uncharacterized protein
MHSPVPALSKTLHALSTLLTKAEAHCEARKIDPAAILAFRLYPDMLSFTKQVQLTCDFCARAVARLSGADVPSFPDVETSFAELQARVATAKAYVDGFAPDRFDGAETREITIPQRSGEMKMSGQDYLSLYSLPQVYFHLTTAHAILRHNGVEIGKRDYMGA